MKNQFPIKLNVAGAILVPLFFLLPFAADLSGQWTGTMEAASRPGTVELTLQRDGTEWSATVRVTWNGMEFANPVTALKVTDNEVTFTTEIAGASARFTGKVEGQLISGTIEATRNGQVVGAGKWTATRTAAAPPVTNAPPPKTNRIIGEVQAIDAGQLSLKLDSGEIITVKFNPQTSYLRVPPGETNLQNAAPISIAVVGIGDRVFANGQLAEDRNSVAARQLIVMAKGDLTAQREREREEWRRRGIVGTITALNSATKEISLLLRSSAGDKPMTLTVSDTVRVRRYAPDSVRFNEAQPSSLAALRPGDQLRALGEKSADGSRFAAEEIVFGTFRTVGGAILEVNAETKEVKVQDLLTQQPLTIIINEDSMLRRLPADLVAQLAKRVRKPPSGSAAEPDWQAMIERLPALALTELKPGERLLASTTRGAQPGRMTAIGLFIGVEALLKLWQEQKTAPGGSSANLNLGLPSGVLDGPGRP